MINENLNLYITKLIIHITEYLSDYIQKNDSKTDVVDFIKELNSILIENQELNLIA